jgi:hypothetical protein
MGPPPDFLLEISPKATNGQAWVMKNLAGLLLRFASIFSPPHGQPIDDTVTEFTALRNKY